MEELWCERYRPKTIKDVILPDRLKSVFLEFVNNKSIPNLLLLGSTGVGKTTVARALCKELDVEYLFINGSDERNIDTLRDKIRSFASSISIDSKHKVVILDEADGLNKQSTQPALRAFMEEFHDNCRFILTANYENGIIEPLQSRCTTINFHFTQDEKVEMMEEFSKRVKFIIIENDLKYDIKIVLTLIYKLAPDWRNILNQLQKKSSNIDSDVDETSLITKLVKVVIDKIFVDMRKLLPELTDIATPTLFNKFYLELVKKEYGIDDEELPAIVITLNDYAFKDRFVIDKELNRAACFAQIMGEL